MADGYFLMRWLFGRDKKYVKCMVRHEVGYCFYLFCLADIVAVGIYTLSVLISWKKLFQHRIAKT